MPFTLGAAIRRPNLPSCRFMIQGIHALHHSGELKLIQFCYLADLLIAQETGSDTTDVAAELEQGQP